MLAGLGPLMGSLWLYLGLRWGRSVRYPVRPVARVGEIPVGGVRLFHYPTGLDPCLLVRVAEHTYVAYSRRCTHLACAVYFMKESGRLECPCHQGHFSIRDGRVLQGPPLQPLPRVLLEQRGDTLLAVGFSAGGTA